MRNMITVYYMKFLSTYFSGIIITLMLFLSSGIFAQTIPDSLLKKLNHPINDSAKAITLLEIGESMEQTMPEKSMDHYRQALLLGLQIKNNQVILSSYIDVCLGSWHTKQFLFAFPFRVPRTGATLFQ